MSKVFISVCRQDCTKYEPCTLSGFQRRFQRHMKTKSVLPLQHSKMSQAQPQAIFAGAYIDKVEGCTFNINVFCDGQSKIARLNDNWSLNDRVTDSCTFGHFLEIFHWARMKRTVILSSFTDEVCTKLDFELLFLTRLDWRLVTEVSQLNAWARTGEQIELLFFYLSISCLLLYVSVSALPNMAHITLWPYMGIAWQATTRVFNNREEKG